MSATKNKKPTKAEKRWQRHLRDVEARRAEEGAFWDGTGGLADGDDDTNDDTEDPALTAKFVKRMLQTGELASGATVLDAKELYGVKLSGAVLDVCQPLIDAAKGEEDPLRTAAMIGIMGWNIACVANGNEEILARQFAQDAAGTLRDRFLAGVMVDALLAVVARKNALYPQIDFILTDHELVFTEDGCMQLNVGGVKLDAGKPDVADEPSRKKGFWDRLRRRSDG